MPENNGTQANQTDPTKKIPFYKRGVAKFTLGVGAFLAVASIGDRCDIGNLAAEGYDGIVDTIDSAFDSVKSGVSKAVTDTPQDAYELLVASCESNKDDIVAGQYDKTFENFRQFLAKTINVEAREAISLNDQKEILQSLIAAGHQEKADQYILALTASYEQFKSQDLKKREEVDCKLSAIQNGDSETLVQLYNEVTGKLGPDPRFKYSLEIIGTSSEDKRSEAIDHLIDTLPQQFRTQVGYIIMESLAPNERLALYEQLAKEDKFSPEECGTVLDVLVQENPDNLQRAVNTVHQRRQYRQSGQTGAAASAPVQNAYRPMQSTHGQYD